MDRDTCHSYWHLSWVYQGLLCDYKNISLKSAIPFSFYMLLNLALVNTQSLDAVQTVCHSISTKLLLNFVRSASSEVLTDDVDISVLLNMQNNVT
jgi:hypothetical protein